MDNDESALYKKLGQCFFDCMTDILDDNSAVMVNGFKSLKYPILVYGIDFPIFVPKSKLSKICGDINSRIVQASQLLDDIDIVQCYPHLNIERNRAGLVTYKVDKINDRWGKRFEIIDNILAFEIIDDGVRTTRFYFCILNPYYSEYNY